MKPSGAHTHPDGSGGPVLALLAVVVMAAIALWKLDRSEQRVLVVRLDDVPGG